MRFTKSHEWVILDGSIGTVGISDHAKDELGEIVYIELPSLNKQVQAGDEICVLESTKAAVDVYTPVSGKVIAVNEELQKNPSLLKDPNPLKSWLFRIELSNLAEWEQLS